MKKILCPKCNSEGVWEEGYEISEGIEKLYSVSKMECRCGHRFKICTSYVMEDWKYTD
ncbi:TPA: hypothetical protein ACOTG0_002081 [Clostridium perfringens]|nr:hypothetical protein phiCPD_00087 [Clostridium phage phiCp-D]